MHIADTAVILLRQQLLVKMANINPTSEETKDEGTKINEESSSATGKFTIGHYFVVTYQTPEC